MLGTSDQLIIDVVLDPNNDNCSKKALPPIEFMICRQKDFKKKVGELKYLETLCKNTKCKSYTVSDKDLANNNTYMVLAEQDEIANGIVTKKIGDLLKDLNKQNQSYLNEVHITDMGTYYKYPLYMRMVIDIPDDHEKPEVKLAIARIVEASMAITDNIAAMKLSSGCVDKCNKARNKIRAHTKKQDEQAEEKARIAKQAEVEKLKRMTPEE